MLVHIYPIDSTSWLDACMLDETILNILKTHDYWVVGTAISHGPTAGTYWVI